jgi:hypothetical protein
LSWREDYRDLTWEEARAYCASRGLTIVSLDSDEKAQHFIHVLEQDGEQYFWAGGRISQ